MDNSRTERGCRGIFHLTFHGNPSGGRRANENNEPAEASRGAQRKGNQLSLASLRNRSSDELVGRSGVDAPEREEEREGRDNNFV